MERKEEELEREMREDRERRLTKQSDRSRHGKKLDRLK
jgi:hypothetical protein